VSADPVEDIADALVVFFEDAESWTAPPSMNFEVIKDAVPDEKLKKELLQNLKVFVVPFGEAAEKIGRGGQALETYQVFVVVARAMNADFTQPKLAKLTRELKLAVRKSPRMAGYPWQGDETSVKLNTPLAREADVFVSGFMVSYTGIR
jgi:hypothetical protein